MPRFKAGDRVRILPMVGNVFGGVDGVIDEVKPHPRNLTALDSYTLLFAWGEKHAFWDAQLEAMPDDITRRSLNGG